MNWRSKNFAVTERLPYSAEEMDAILEAARTLPLDRQHVITNAEIEAFILMQRYAGLAIADASLLQKSELRGDEVRYYRKKLLRNPKRQLVVVPLPVEVIAKLTALETDGRYFFCHGPDRLESAVNVWITILSKVFTRAATIGGTSHRFRHTFACELLTKRHTARIGQQVVRAR